MELYEHYCVGKMMTTVSAAEDDDVYAVDDEVTLCMGFTHVHCQNGYAACYLEREKKKKRGR